eukprot:6259260-Pyramimonas_sp.AAC.1
MQSNERNACNAREAQYKHKNITFRCEDKATQRIASRSERSKRKAKGKQCSPAQYESRAKASAHATQHNSMQSTER